VVRDETGRRGRVHHEIEAGAEAVVDRDAVVERLARGAVAEGERIPAVATGDVADVHVSLRAGVVVAGVAVVPGPILERDVAAGSRLQVLTGILVVVKPVPCDPVPRSTVEINPVRFPVSGEGVPEGFVALHGRASRAPRQRDAMI